jgi:YVTN family beta-propeller protein
MALIVTAGTIVVAPQLPAPPAGASGSAPIAYVANINKQVVPVDTSTNTAGSPIAVGSNPWEIAITPDGTTAYVANGGDNTVTPIDTATNAPETAISLGRSPFGVAITPDGRFVYVTTTNEGSGTVTPIDTASKTAGTPISISNPGHIAITPNGKTAYVTTSSGTVVPINLSTNTPGSAITVASGLQEIAITPDGKTAYVASSNTNTVTPITLATNTVGTPINVGSGPLGIAITPDGKTAFVTNSNDNSVTPIDIGTNAAGTAITGVGSFPYWIAITPDGKTAYVATSGANTITPITLSSKTVGTPINVGGPRDLAITPDQAPVAKLSVTPAAAGSPTSFDASASLAPSSPIATYAWDFGDGTKTTTSSPTTTHTYTTSGTFTATVTETDAAGTSTTLVFTGQTVSRTGGPGAQAAATFVVKSCSTGTTCSATVTAPSQTVMVTGTRSTGTATISLSVSPQTLSCPGFSYRAPVLTLTDTGLASGSKVSVTDTVKSLPSVTGIHICYQPVGPTPPNPIFLSKCPAGHPPSPCFKSLTEVKGSVKAVLSVPAGDPRVHVGVAPPSITSFTPTSGAPGKAVVITGRNLSEVTTVSFGGTSAKILSRSVTTLKVAVPTGAKSGAIEVSSLAGVAFSTTSFKVT